MADEYVVGGITAKIDADTSSAEKSVDKFRVQTEKPIKVKIETEDSGISKVFKESEEVISKSIKGNKELLEIARARRKAEKEVDEQIKKASESTEKAVRDLDNLIGILKVVALGKVGKSLFESFIGTNEQYELAVTQFETLLGSAERANNVLKGLTSIALESPYNIQELREVTKQLMAMGIESDYVVDTVKRLGDISMGNTDQLKRMAYAFSEVASKGQLFSSEIKQFVSAGVPLLDELANNLGKTKKEIKEMVTAGEIGLPEVTAAIVSMTSEGGRFYKMSESVTETFFGMKEKFKESIQEMGRISGEEAFESIKDEFREITELMDELSESEDFRVFVSDIANALGSVVTTVMNVAQYLIEHRELVKTIVIEYAAFKGINAIMLPMILNFTEISTIMKSLFSVMKSGNLVMEAQNILSGKSVIARNNLTGAISIESVETLKSAASAKAEAIAKNEATIATTAAEISTKTDTAAKIENTSVTYTATAATGAFKTALASTGIGLAVIAVGALATAFTKLKDSTKKASEEALKSSKSFKDEYESLKKLNEEYKKTETIEDAGDKKRALIDITNRLKESYGDEVEALNLLSGSYEDNAKAFEEMELKKLESQEKALIVGIEAAKKLMEQESAIYTPSKWELDVGSAGLTAFAGVDITIKRSVEEQYKLLEQLSDKWTEMYKRASSPEEKKKASESLEVITKKLESLDNKYSASAEHIKAYNENQDALADINSNASKSMEEMTKSTDEAGESLKSTTELIKEQKDEISRLRGEYKTYSSDIADLIKMQDEFKKTGTISFESFEKIVNKYPELLAVYKDEEEYQQRINELINEKAIAVDKVQAGILSAYEEQKSLEGDETFRSTNKEKEESSKQSNTNILTDDKNTLGLRKKSQDDVMSYTKITEQKRLDIVKENNRKILQSDKDTAKERQKVGSIFDVTGVEDTEVKGVSLTETVENIKKESDKIVEVKKAEADASVRIISEANKQIAKENEEAANKAKKEAEELEKEKRKSYLDTVNKQLDYQKYALDMGYISEVKYLNSITQIRDKSLQGYNDEYKRLTLDIKKLNEKLAEEEKKLRLDTANKQLEYYKYALEMNYISEKKYLEKITEVRNTGLKGYTDEYRKVTLEIKQLNEQMAMESVETSKTWISEREFFGDWENFGDTAIAAYGRVLDKLEVIYETGLIAEKDYINAKRDITQSLVTAEREASSQRLSEMEVHISDIEFYIMSWSDTQWDMIHEYENIRRAWEKEYKNGLITKENYISKNRELDRLEYTYLRENATKKIDTIIEDNKRIAEEQVESLNEQLRLMRESYAAEDRETSLKDAQRRMAQYAGARTAGGIEQYEKAAEDVKKIQREEERIQIEKDIGERIKTIQENAEIDSIEKDALIKEEMDRMMQVSGLQLESLNNIGYGITSLNDVLNDFLSNLKNMSGLDIGTKASNVYNQQQTVNMNIKGATSPEIQNSVYAGMTQANVMRTAYGKAR